MRADGEVMEEMRESHRGMVDGFRWNGGGMGYRVARAWVSKGRENWLITAK